MEANQKILDKLLQRGTGSGDGEGKSPAGATDRPPRTVALARPSYSGEGNESLTGVRAVGSSAKDLRNESRTLNMRNEEDLLRSPPPGPSGQGEGDFRTVRSKRSIKREKAKLQKQRPVSEQQLPFQQPAGADSSAAEGQGLVRPPKKKRQSTNPEEHRPAKRRNQAQDGPRQTAKERSDLAVAIHRADGAPVDANLAEIIRSRICDLIMKAVREQEDSDRLSFANSGLVSEGFFLVTPMNILAREWLLSRDLGLYDGVQLRSTRRDRGKISIWVPGTQRTENPVECLIGQNRKRPELQIHEWSLIVRETLPSGGERLILGVPQEVCHHFEKDGVWLCYQITRVNARLLPSSRTKTDTPDVDMTDTTQCPSTGVTGVDSGGDSSCKADQSRGHASGDNSTPPQCPPGTGEPGAAGPSRMDTSQRENRPKSDAEKIAGALTGTR